MSTDREIKDLTDDLNSRFRELTDLISENWLELSKINNTLQSFKDGTCIKENLASWNKEYFFKDRHKTKKEEPLEMD